MGSRLAAYWKDKLSVPSASLTGPQPVIIGATLDPVPMYHQPQSPYSPSDKWGENSLLTEVSVEKGTGWIRVRRSQEGTGWVGPFLGLLGPKQGARRERGYNRRPGELQLWLLLPW